MSVSQPINAVIGDGEGLGTILDDEGRIKMPSAATGTAKPAAPARIPPTRPVAIRTQVILRRLGLKPHLEP